MSVGSRNEDLSTLLYLVPFLGGAAYAIGLWVQAGASFFLPTTVYLTVTRDPYLFMLGSLAVLLGVMIEMNSTDPTARPAKLAPLGDTLQSIAIASLAIVLLSAWYANGFTDLTGAGNDLLVGRYGLMFPALMVLMSYLLTARFRLEALADRKVLAIIAMLLVPASLYEIGRRQLALGLGMAFLFLLAGLFLYLTPARKEAPPKED